MAEMRLDKFLAQVGSLSRTEAGRAVRAGRVWVNGCPAAAADRKVNPTEDHIFLDGRELQYTPYVYVMLNKPQGYVSATDDEREKTVLELLPLELQKRGLFTCGRLDKNTVGLMLLTDNGAMAHFLLSPKRHVSKTYVFHAKEPVTEAMKQCLEKGVDIGGYVTKPCSVEILPLGGTITLTEGKYHQIKKMLCAVGNEVTALERVTFGPLALDSRLERGQWRFLTKTEIAALENACLCPIKENKSNK